MLKISVDKGETETLFILEGSLSGPWVAELHKAVMDRLAIPEAIYLELSHVHYVDEQGLALLRDLSNWGVTSRAASPFIKELLKTDHLV
jgi:ABC-type transporter Mla MlaB component